MLAANFLLLGAVLFCIGVFGVLARRNAVMVLMSVELILNSVNINLLAFTQLRNAIDGNTSTRWSSQFSDPQSITIDLGEANTVTGVKLNWEYAAGQSYSIQTSADGTTWRAASFSTTTGDGGVDEITFAAAASNTRYVRMTGTQRGTPYGYSLWEFQVNGY